MGARRLKNSPQEAMSTHGPRTPYGALFSFETIHRAIYWRCEHPYCPGVMGQHGLRSCDPLLREVVMRGHRLIKVDRGNA